MSRSLGIANLAPRQKWEFGNLFFRHTHFCSYQAGAIPCLTRTQNESPLRGPSGALLIGRRLFSVLIGSRDGSLRSMERSGTFPRSDESQDFELGDHSRACLSTDPVKGVRIGSRGFLVKRGEYGLKFLATYSHDHLDSIQLRLLKRLMSEKRPPHRSCIKRDRDFRTIHRRTG
jgi:hypothetical protein